MYIDEVARKLKPYWLKDVQSGVARAASSSDSGWQAWTISHLADPDPHPQYLTQPEGDALYVPLSRTLTGGAGINAIGNLTADRTISVNYGAGLSMSSNVLVMGIPTSLSISTTNAVASGTHSHAVIYTTTGAASTLVATTPGADIVAGRDITATRNVDATGFIYSHGSVAELDFDDRASPGTAARWAWFASGGVAALFGPGTGGANRLSISSLGLVTALGTNSGFTVEDRTTVGTGNSWLAYADAGVFRLSRGGDKFSVDTSGYAVATRFGAGVTSPANALHGRAASNQLRIDVDASGYTLFTVSGAGVLDIVPSGNLIRSNNFQYGSTFFSGFAGAGWKIEYTSGRAAMETDDLIVRGRMRVYELLVTQIRATNGNVFVTSTGRIKTVTGSGPYTLSTGSVSGTDADPYHGFAVGDLIRAQRFIPTGSGAVVYQCNMQVTAVTNLWTFVATLVSGDAPLPGFDFVRLGNVSSGSRRGSIYLTADDSGAPFIDIIDGVASFSDWGTPAKTKARLGNLDGVSDAFWGDLTGYGIYTQYGYFRNVKINGSIVIGSSIGMSLAAMLYIKGDTAPNSFVPNTNGHLGQAGFRVGGVSAFPLGPFAGAGAIAIGEGGVNRIVNPRFAHATTFTGWTAGANTTATLSTDALFGTTAAQIVSTGSAGNRYLATLITRTNTSTPLTISAWVKSNTGNALVKLGIWRADLLAASASTDYTVGPDWQRITWTASVASMSGFSTSVYALISNDSDTTSKTVIVGFVQVEERLYATPAICGDFGPGFGWAGVAHNSMSSQTAAGLVYAPTGNLPTVVGSAGGWFWAGTTNSGTNAGNRVIFHTDAGPYLVLRVTPTNTLEGYWGSATISGGTVTPNTWNHGLITSDGATIRVLLNGVQVASGTYNGPVGQSNLQVGSYQGAQQWMNGYVADLFVTDRTLTSDEALMIANAKAPLTITRSNFEFVLAEPGFGRITGNAGGIYAVTPNAANSFMLLNSTQTWNGETFGPGSMLLGDNNTSNGGPNLSYNTTTGALLIRNKQVNVISLLSTANGLGQIATFDGVIGISAAGGIWQGSSGTFASPTTGFKLYTSSSKAILETWLTGVRQVYIEPTDMSLRAGAGNVILDGAGIRLKTATVPNAYASVSSLRFTDSTDTALVNLQAYSDPTGNVFSRYISDPSWATQQSSFAMQINSVLGGQLEISTAGTSSFLSAAIYLESRTGGFGGWIRLAASVVRVEASNTFWGNNTRIVHGNAVWQPTSGTSISTGTTTVDYTPSSANWSAFSGTMANIVLNGLTYTAIAFHDASSRVDAIRVGAGLMDIGPDIGWGSPAVKINNPRFSFGGVATSTTAGTQGDVRVDANYVYVCTATNTWKRAALVTF